jgi:hypothetical protein
MWMHHMPMTFTSNAPLQAMLSSLLVVLLLIIPKHNPSLQVAVLKQNFSPLSAKYLQSILAQLGFPQLGPTPISEDN